LTDAFAADAIVRFVLPDDATYPDLAALFFGHYFDVRIEGGEVFVHGDADGVSLWNPPGGNRHGAAFVGEHWRSKVVPSLPANELARHEAFTEVLDAMTPREDHWYLGLLGTAPANQRTGVATALLTPMLARADQERTPVFLETGMPRNVAFYERFGFGVVAEEVVPAGPRVWGMVRPPA